jgi:hypothetical protein
MTQSAMGKQAYHDALELRLKELTNRIVILKLRRERMEGVNRVCYGREIHRLERLQQDLRTRLRRLERERDGFWADLKADIRGVIDELPSGVERWVERLDWNYAAGSTYPETGNHSITARDHAQDGDE